MKLITQRLELIPATFELIHADLKGRSHLARIMGVNVPASWPPPLTEFAVMLWFKQQLKQTPDWAGWFSWYWVSRRGRILIGLGGFKGAPDAAGTVELGYSVLGEFQRQGYATEATSALTDWALDHAEVHRVIAEVLPRRAASIRVLEKSRFKRFDVNSQNGALRFALDRSTSERSASERHQS